MSKKLRIAALVVLAGIVLSLGQYVNVYAGNEGGNVGSGGDAQNCGSLGSSVFLSTCFGMTWRYYSWGEAAAGVTYNADGTISIAGDPRGDYAKATTITGCANAGGYYRYGMVALRTATINGVTYHAGDQVGTIGIGGSSVYGSEYFGGSGNYIGNNWSEVQGIYQGLQASDPSTYWRGWSGGSDLSWFCADGSGTGTPNIPQLTCGVSGNTTTMTTRVLNNRLKGAYSGWRTQTYAMPTDDLAWYNCYAPGVQNMYKRRGDTLRKAILNGGTVADYEPGHPYNNNFRSHPVYANTYCNQYSDWTNNYTGSTAMKNHWDSWENYWWLNKNFSPYYSNGAQPSSYGLGDATGRRLDERYAVNGTGDVGNILSESTGTGQPIYFDIWNEGDHAGWPASGTYPCLVRVRDYPNDRWVHHNAAWVPYDQAICNEYGVPASQCGWQTDAWDELVYEAWKDENSSVTVNNRHSSGYVIGSLNTGPTGDYAEARVPFNFINTPYAKVAATNSDGLVYSGDTIKLEVAEVNVQGKANSLTENYYATIVKGAQMKIVSFLTPTLPSTGFTSSSGDLCSMFNVKRCDVLGSKSGTLNSSGNLAGARETIGDVEGTYQAYDASAGDYMCFAVAVYPYTSGWDGNLDQNGDRTWAISTDCLKVAKKPFFGVLGGSMYSNPSVNTTSMGKTNILWRDNFGYKGRPVGSKLYFGSFVEQSIYGINGISGIASGSAYQENKGISNNDFCSNLVPLTFANAGTKFCNGSESAGHMGDTGVANVDKASYVDFWLRSSLDTGEAGPTDGFGASKKFYSNTGKNIYYTNTSGDIVVGSTVSVGNGTTRLVKAGGNIYIRANILYSQSGSKIDTAGDIPQTIVYANNVTIGCNVTRIDAILIAKSVVNTCEGYSGANYAPAANPLVVRGVIITDGLNLYRTYGAAIDGYSGTPAELVNYDTSTVLWARYMAGASESNTMTEVYRTELAPRY